MQDWKYQPAGDLALSRRQRLRSPVRESGFLGRCSCTLWNALLRTYFHYFQTLTIRGRENIPPRPPFILASNHTSHLDALCWPTRCRCGCGTMFFRSPPATLFSSGRWFRLSPPRWSTPCRSPAKAPDAMRFRSFARACSMNRAHTFCFPKETRSRSGQIAPFRPGIGMLVAQTDVPVIPCHIAGAFAAFSRQPQNPAPCRQISLTLGAPLKFPDIPNSRDGWTRIAQTLHAAVLALAAPASSNP